MFVTEDRLLRDGARVRARRSLVSAESLPTSATFGQTPTCATHHRVPPPGEVVVPWPEGRGICFSTNSSADVPPVFSSLRVLFSAQQLQPTPNQSVAHSLLKRKSLTHIFSMISTLRDHSAAPERKSTPLFSGACALFRKTHRGTPPKILPQWDSQRSGAFRQSARARASGFASNFRGFCSAWYTPK